ncbi:hypothetical protein, partial [Mesorhizobium sp. ES1-6]|uniref:hypothetical protein n=1 Tax=Mesorhizobium sp. ES1-6 TaxID=2876626 RepID=UPI001CC98D1F
MILVQWVPQALLELRVPQVTPALLVRRAIPELPVRRAIPELPVRLAQRVQPALWVTLERLVILVQRVPQALLEQLELRVPQVTPALLVRRAIPELPVQLAIPELPVRLAQRVQPALWVTLGRLVILVQRVPQALLEQLELRVPQVT